MAATDRIEIREFRLLLICGVLPEEQIRKQPFEFNLDLYVDLENVNQSTVLSETIDYGSVLDQIVELTANKKYQLMETLAEDVCSLLLAEFKISRIVANVKKLRPPVASQLGSAGVHMTRSK